MTDKKLLLRVSIKLMFFISFVFVTYILFSGLSTNEKEVSGAKILQLDISDLEPGDIKYFSIDSRKILVLFRTESMAQELKKTMPEREDGFVFRSMVPEYFVAFAYDPFYGCPVEMGDGFFKASCVDVKYDFSGRVYQSTQADSDLVVPNYEVVSGKFITLFLD